MSQQDENLLPDWDNLPIQERLRKLRERNKEEEKQQVFRRQIEELGLSEAVRLRTQRESYKERQQEFARRRQEREEVRQKEQCSFFRRFLSECTEEGESYSISYKTLKDWYQAWVSQNGLPRPYGPHPIDEVLKDKFLRDEQGYTGRILGLRMKRPITIPATYLPGSYARGRRPRRKQITRSTRKDVLDKFNASGRICPLCDKVVEAHEKLHLDHIIPVSEGGTDDISNLHYVHAGCNLGKYTSTMETAKKGFRLGDLWSVTRRMSHSSNMAIRNGENTSVRAVVNWNDQKGKWQAQISINGRLKLLGYYKYEEHALEVCQDVLNDRRPNISIFEGVKWIDRRKKWQAQVWIDGRLEHLGYYEDEETAHEAYQKARASIGEA